MTGLLPPDHRTFRRAPRADTGRGGRVIVRWIMRLAAGVVTAGLAYAAFAYRAYTRVLPAERPCRGCSPALHVNGYDLFARLVGSDTAHPPVIVVHGGPGHSSLSFRRSLDFLAVDRRVLYYDQRGSGYSESKPRVVDYHIDSLVDELEAIRRDVLRAERVVLVGHSFGSALVQRYAIRHRAHVDRLVIVGGIRLNNGMTNRWLWTYAGPALYSTAMGIPRGTGGEADDWFTNRGDRDNAARLFDRTRGALLDSMGPISFAPWRAISLSLVGDAQEEALRTLDVPTLVVWGAADTRYTGRPTAEALCTLLPRCSTAGFDRSGHWPFLEEPERFQRAVGAFVRR